MNTPEDLDRLIQDALADLGVTADAAALARKVALLNLGLPAEDEFSVICAWLGRCRLVHKLDQLQSPTNSRDLYQVPDLLADFGLHGAMLVEVKTSQKEKLSFTADYHRRLTAYATLIGKPLLIAWKWRTMWALFDIRQMKLAKTNFNITFGYALRHNLLGPLVGDVMFRLAAGAGVRITAAKEELLSTTCHEDAAFTEEWNMRISGVKFLKAGGVVASDLHAETVQILLAANLESREHHFDDRVEMNFIIGEEAAQFAHMALIGVLAWERQTLDAGDWRALLRTSRITETIEDFPKALDRALGEGVIHHIFHLQPVEFPDFMRSAEARE